MNAEVITIGDELLRGEIVDSNKARIADRLLLLDVECRHQVSVMDDPADMEDAFSRAARRSDLVLVSGGLGPTRDDLTTEVMAKTFDRKLELDDASLAEIEAFFSRMGREMADVNRKQAFFPVGADVLRNPIGTAPGFSIEVGRAVFFAMPGVPRELDKMMDEQVMPRIEARQRAIAQKASAQKVSAQKVSAKTQEDSVQPRVVRAALLRTFGMGESTLEAELRDLARDGDVELGFRTSFPDNFLRPFARAQSAEEADARIEAVVRAIGERLGPIVYGEGDETMESVTGDLLARRGLSVATAESCTGGLIAERITDVPGSSEYFKGGVVAYSNEAKASLLGVPIALIENHGAVSEPVARAMAEGARKKFGSDIAVATTGISGPGGGTPEKPVGLVWIALSMGAEIGTTLHADSFVFSVDRSRHRQLTAQVALDWIRRTLIGAELVGPSLLRRAGGSSAPSDQKL